MPLKIQNHYDFGDYFFLGEKTLGDFCNFLGAFLNMISKKFFNDHNP